MVALLCFAKRRTVGRTCAARDPLCRTAGYVLWNYRFGNAVCVCVSVASERPWLRLSRFSREVVGEMCGIRRRRSDAFGRDRKIPYNYDSFSRAVVIGVREVKDVRVFSIGGNRCGDVVVTYRLLLMNRQSVSSFLHCRLRDCVGI